MPMMNSGANRRIVSSKEAYYKLTFYMSFSSFTSQTLLPSRLVVKYSARSLAPKIITGLSWCFSFKN